MIIIEKVPEFKVSLKAETIKDQVIIKKLLRLNQVGDWEDLLVYLQKKYEHV